MGDGATRDEYMGDAQAGTGWWQHRRTLCCPCGPERPSCCSGVRGAAWTRRAGGKPCLEEPEKHAAAVAEAVAPPGGRFPLHTLPGSPSYFSQKTSSV